jgi:predicted transcriptional regulator
VTGEKLTTAFAVRCGPALAERLDEMQRERERATGVPLSRALFVRLLLEELAGLKCTPRESATISKGIKDPTKASSAG